MKIKISGTPVQLNELKSLLQKETQEDALQIEGPIGKTSLPFEADSLGQIEVAILVLNFTAAVVAPVISSEILRLIEKFRGKKGNENVAVETKEIEKNE